MYVKKQMEVRSVWLRALATCLSRDHEGPFLGFLCFTHLIYVYIRDQYSTSGSVDRSSSQAYASTAYMAWGFYTINRKHFGGILPWVSFDMVPLSEGAVVGLDSLL